MIADALWYVLFHLLYPLVLLLPQSELMIPNPVELLVTLHMLDRWVPIHEVLQVAVLYMAGIPFFVTIRVFTWVYRLIPFKAT